MDNLLSTLVSSAVGLMSALVAAYLSAQWAIRRTLREQWWHQKFKVYSEIIEALHHLVWYSEDLTEFYNNAEHARLGPKHAERHDKYLDAQLVIRKATDIGSFIISEDAADLLLNLKKDTEVDDDQVPNEVIVNSQRDCYQKALGQIRVCAKEDLRGAWRNSK